MAKTRNVFRRAVLAAARELDAPATLPLAGSAGPWEVVLTPDGWAVRSLDGGDLAAVAEDFETAALIAAVLPIEARPAAYDVTGDEIRMTFGGSGPGHVTVARFPAYHPDIDAALEAVHLAASCPRSLAWILASADADTLTRAGELLARILEQRAEDQRAVQRRRVERLSS